MKTEDYNNRLPEYQEPLELPAHKEREATAKTPRAPREAQTADVDEVRGFGGFGWAMLAAAAVAVFVGAIYFFSDRAEKYHPDIAEVTTPVGNSAKPFAAKMITVRNAAPQSATASATDTQGAQVTEDVVYLFPLDGSDIQANAALDNLAGRVSGNQQAYVVVTAYTDESGRAAYNQRLSEKRARKVGQYLVAHGVPASHVKTVGKGETHKYPTVEQNRRAEVHVNY
ncbi:MAG: OmpA family protein [Muribaculaceae bacterium]|nr:OmpA family protein [Muribaculaceae bacterium]